MTHRHMDWKLALIDLDGTLYRGSHPIDGSDEFVARLREQGIQPVFFTNNATRTPLAVVQHLERFGILALPHEVVTSAQAAARRLGPVEKTGYVLYVGQEGLAEALREEGHRALSVRHPKVRERLELVYANVLGLDSEVTYSELAIFSAKVQELNAFLLTNTDKRLPTEHGFMPGNGAIGAFVETATDVHPYVAGKPNPDFIEFALERFEVAREETFVVGDNLATDIRCGREAGVYTILVESGVSQIAGKTPSEDLLPDEIVPSVRSLF